MLTHRSLILVLPTLLLAAACGDDGGSGGRLDQDGLVSGPDGLLGDDASHDVADDTAGGDTMATDTGGADTVTADSISADAVTADTVSADTVETCVTANADGPALTIRVDGAFEDRSPADGLAAQTPTTWIYGLQRLELLRSVDDPHPEVVFDYAPGFVLVDLLANNEVAHVPIACLPTGTFTYFRIVLTHEEIVVASTLHQVPVLVDYATPLDITYALSDVHLNGHDLKQGDVIVKANIFGTEYAVPSRWDVPAPSPAPDAWATALNGEWLVTFAIAPSLVPSSTVGVDVTYGIRFYVTNAFRWEDQATTGYTTGVWDISLGPPATFEPVKRLGANGYEVYQRL